MSAPSSITLGASPHPAQAPRKGLGGRASSRDFHALMDSLTEKDAAATKGDGAEGASLSATKLSASASPMLNLALKNEAGPPTPMSLPGYDANAQPLAIKLPSDASRVAGVGRDPTVELGAELRSLLSPVEQRSNALSALAESNDGRMTAEASPVMSSNGHEGASSTAFSTVADEIQLRVTRAASHFGAVPTVGVDAPVEQKPRPATQSQTVETTAGRAKPEFTAAGHPAVEVQASREAAPAQSEDKPSLALTHLNDVPLPLVPQLFAEAVEDLQSMQSQSASAGPGVSTPEARIHASAVVTRELEIHLSPAGLGSLLVKMKLSGGALSVVVQASKPSTLNAVESARDVIVERLSETNQVTASLLVKPLHFNQSLPENTNASSSRPAMREDSQRQADTGRESSERRGRKEEYLARRQEDSGGANDLVL